MFALRKDSCCFKISLAVHVAVTSILACFIERFVPLYPPLGIYYMKYLRNIIISRIHTILPFFERREQTLKSKILKSLFRFLRLFKFDGITVPYQKIGILDRFERLGETLSLFSTSSS